MGKRGRPDQSAVRLFARGGLARRAVLASTLAGASMLLLSHTVLGRAAGDDYSVSVALTLRPHDPALWSLVNADNFEEARVLDPDLPDPFALPTLGESAPGAPPAGLAALRQEAYTGPSAPRYVFRGATAADTARAHYCLTAAIYYEAASESEDGMRGVAQVVLNRTRHPSFPGSVCGVVFQGSQRTTVCQFTFACDGAMARAPDRQIWARSSRIAAEALAGRVFSPVGLATHYHTQAVWPSWGRSLAMTNVVGAHIFHRWRGRFGEPAAFSRPYAGREPQPGPYLPIAQQLAARAGRPAGEGAPADAAALAAIGGAPAAIPVPAVRAAPSTQPGFASAPVPAAPSADYADARLAESGTVRAEFRDSGSAITR